MSYWTTVRIMYDVQKIRPKRHCKIDSDAFGYIDIKQCFETANHELLFEKNTIFDLGSEGCVDLHLEQCYDMSSFGCGESLQTATTGILTITGNLRDCTREDFIPKLNGYVNHLARYGISIMSGLVQIT